MSPSISVAPAPGPSSSASGSVPGVYDFSFLIPTRNNVPGLRQLFDSIVATTANLSAVEVVLAIDEDDAETQAIGHERLQFRKIVVPPGLTMGALNNACFEASLGRFIMLMNDDVVLRTAGWDRQVASVFARFQDEIALVHVNDLLFRENLCTFPILSRRACLEIGVCPTAYRRYRIDDHIYDIYNLLAHLGYRRIVYLPEVIFEHENHERKAGPPNRHQFVSADKKAYAPKAGIVEADARYCDQQFEVRKQAALKLAELIETHASEHSIQVLQRDGAARLAALNDSHSYRQTSYLQVQPTGVRRNSSNARTTVAVVTADLQGRLARRCLQAIKQHTRNYDLVVLDNNRGPCFSHPQEMNRILQTCNTEFLVLLDDDVFVERGWLDGLLGCLDDETGVVVPVHKDRNGKVSFSGIYFVDDGLGTHAHTVDRPEGPRVVQTYCSAAMLIDMRKCGHIRMDEAYSKYFFDLVHGFEVWEAGWKAVCCPEVEMMHLGGATMNWGSAEANTLQKRDRGIFVRSWLDSGRLERLRAGIWQRHPYLLQLTALSRQVECFVGEAPLMPQAEFEAELARTLNACTPFPLLGQRLAGGLKARRLVSPEKRRIAGRALTASQADQAMGALMNSYVKGRPWPNRVLKRVVSHKLRRSVRKRLVTIGRWFKD